MVRTTRLISLLVCVWSWASPVHAAEPAQPVMQLTYAQALTLARSQSPMLAVARARVVEAEREVDAAGVWPLNPQIQASAGPRFGADGTRVDASVRATQWLEVGGQRGHRVDAARARLDAGEARSEDAQRLLLREVSLAFVVALYWQRRVEITETKLELATATATVARRRHELGDVGGLEESSASLAVAHAQLELDHARAAVELAEGQLAALLGVEAETTVDVVGDLREFAIVDDPIELDLDARPDLRALEADARAAQAMRALGRARRAPSLAVGVGYDHEESEHIVLGVVGLSLPVFDRGQGTVAVAEAGEARVQAQIDATRTTAAVVAATHASVLQRTHAAALQFERDGLAQLERSEQLMTVSYEKGAIAYDEVLVVRLELIAAKLDYADLLLAAATARVELAATAGVFP